MVTTEALRLAEQYLWLPPDALWLGAGAVRATPRVAGQGYWDAEDGKLIERVSDSPPWFGPAWPGWRVQKDPRLAYVSFTVARAVRCLPELMARELAGRGAPRLDARLTDVRAAAREIGWRPTVVRQFVSRQVPFNPITAELVCKWLVLSTGTDQ